MDLNKLGLAVGVLALLLAVPLAVLANILTPRLQSWYSTTSLNRLNKRIARLTTKLRESEESWTFTPAEWKDYSKHHNHRVVVYYALLCLFYLLFGVFVTGVSVYTQHYAQFRLGRLPWNDLKVIALMLVSGLAGVILLMVKVQYDILEHIKVKRMHTLQGRLRLRREIDRLRALKYQRESSESSE